MVSSSCTTLTNNSDEEDISFINNSIYAPFLSCMCQQAQEIAKELEISFYFCKPYHSWERGANENMNGLIRQYIPKGTDYSGITDEFVAWVEDKLNNRPRKRLGYLTPNEKFNLLLTN